MRTLPAPKRRLHPSCAAGGGPSSNAAGQQRKDATWPKVPNGKPSSYRAFPWAQGAWNMACLVCFGQRREGLSCHRPSGSEAQPGAPRPFLVTPASSIPRACPRFAPKELPQKKRLVEKLPVGFGSQLHVEVVHMGTVVVGRQHVGEHARLRHFTHDGPEFFSSG